MSENLIRKVKGNEQEKKKNNFYQLKQNNNQLFSD